MCSTNAQILKALDRSRIRSHSAAQCDFPDGAKFRPAQPPRAALESVMGTVSTTLPSDAAITGFPLRRLQILTVRP
jgi:hypothetical protein